MSFLKVKHLGFTFSLLISSNMAWSALQTTPYIAVHDKPKYANLTAMPYANPLAPKGGYISLSGKETFDNLNAMNGKGSTVEGIDYVFDSLMQSSLDEPGIMYPLLAEKVTFDPEHPKYVIYHLNPKAKFSDGTALTAEDVKFSFDTYQTKSNAGLQMYISDLEKTEVLSKHQVKVTFKSDNNSEMPLIMATLPIYSKKDRKNKDFTKITMQPILGSGPYLIERIDSGRSITYKRNPNYWGKDITINKGRYNFDRIKYVYYRNLDVAFEGFKTGQITYHEEYTARKWVTEYKFPAVNSGLIKTLKFKHYNPSTTQSYVFNTRKAPFTDIRFRQALSYAYDFEWQNKALFYGQYYRLQSYFSNSELEAKGLPSPEEMALLKPLLPKLSQIQRNGALSDWKYPITDATGFNRNNLLIARQLLLNAGYKYKDGKLLDLKGQPIQFEIMIFQDNLQRTLIPFVRNLKRLGIDASIRQIDVPQYVERMRKADFEMTTNALPQSLNPGNEQAQFWGSAAADQPGNYNYAGIKNPAIDEAIQMVIRAPNREQLIIRTRVLDRLLRAGYYQILTYGKGENWLAYWNMYKQPEVKPRLSVGVDYWWSEPTQAQKVTQYLRKQ